MYFRNLVLFAFATATLATLVFGTYQSLYVTPIILDAELYEIAEPNLETTESWEPGSGLERTFFTITANFLACFGYALLLLSFMAIKGKISLLQGFLWGLAGYISFFVAPGFGLPPEIPGMEAAMLEGRQGWWLTTVFLTASSLALIAFAKIFSKLTGIVLLLLPHLIGAPQPEQHGFNHPDPTAVNNLELLWQQFLVQTSIANGLLWIIIGITGAYFVAKFIDPLEKY